VVATTLGVVPRAEMTAIESIAFPSTPTAPVGVDNCEHVMIDALASPVAKSMVGAERSGDTTRYQLLETLRSDPSLRDTKSRTTDPVSRQGARVWQCGVVDPGRGRRGRLRPRCSDGQGSGAAPPDPRQCFRAITNWWSLRMR
jgi:hypothetical protein